MERMVHFRVGAILLVLLITTLFGCGHKETIHRSEPVTSIGASDRIIDPNEAYDRSWAVIIGINQFDDPSISPLNSAEDDASRMKSLLELRGFKVRFLTGAKATKKNIMHELGTALPKRAKPKDRVVVYYAGHGAEHDIGSAKEGYLIAHDSILKELPDTGIPMAQVKKWVENYMATHAVLLVDACHAG